MTAMASKRGEQGLTLIELMVVVAIVGILVGAAVLSFSPSRYARTARGYGELLNAEVEVMRLRASASGKWQRFEVFDDGVIQYQSKESIGMSSPTAADWIETAQYPTPRGVEIYAHANSTLDQNGDPLPAKGSGLAVDDYGGTADFPGNTIDFLPDGSMRGPATLYIHDDDDTIRARLAIYRATGTAYLLDQW